MTKKRKATMKWLVMLDDDGNRVTKGDTVRFNYGIPPVCVTAKVVQRGKSLIALTPGHNPPECNLQSLRRYVGNWYKHSERGQPCVRNLQTRTTSNWQLPGQCLRPKETVMKKLEKKIHAADKAIREALTEAAKRKKSRCADTLTEASLLMDDALGQMR